MTTQPKTSLTKTKSTAANAVVDLDAELDRIAAMSVEQLRKRWHERKPAKPQAALSKDLLARALAYEVQEDHLGGLSSAMGRLLGSILKNGAAPTRRLKAGSIIVREHAGVVHEVMVLPDGYLWNSKTYASLSVIARRITGVSWSGPRFFGLRNQKADRLNDGVSSEVAAASMTNRPIYLQPIKAPIRRSRL
jgi:hypothetical protein